MFYDSDDMEVTYEVRAGDGESGEEMNSNEDTGGETMNSDPGISVEDVEEVLSGGDDEEEDSNDEEGGGNNEDAENNNSQLKMPERKKKEPSLVWQVALRVEGGAKCKVCHKFYKGSRGNTSNIIGHIIAKHKNKPEVKKFILEQEKNKEKLKVKRLEKDLKVSRNRQPSILNFTKRRGLLDPMKKKKLDAALVQMTIGMNRPFDDVENHYLRKLLFVAEPNYLAPSRRTHTSHFDLEAEVVQQKLMKEIVKDVEDAGHDTINITSDHGTSSDQFRTKKNALTVARCTKDYLIKKDIVKMIKCEGSQTGQKIREDVKKALQEQAGWREGWTVNWVTDNESKQINASHPNKHHGVGLETNYTGTCVDHTSELVIEESMERCPKVKDAVHKLRCFVNYIKDSSLAREKFHQLLVDAGVETMSIIQGTSNR